jgi:HEAT repeat protein
VTSRDLLVVVALAQGVVFLVLVSAILVNRWVRNARRAAVKPRRQALDAAMKGWALDETGPDPVARAVTALPRGIAVDALLGWSTRLPSDRWRSLAATLERHPWAGRLRRAVRSRRWWARLEAARFLSVVAAPEDVPLLARLLADAHPAVHIAAAAALERHRDPQLVALVLERIPQMASPLQAYYAGVLRHAHTVAVPLLVERLGRVYDPGLPRTVEFAWRLGDAGLRDAVTGLADHRDPEVRLQVARALGSLPHARSVATLSTLSTDAAWEVRAQAARALGRIADPAALSILIPRLADAVLWVRLRAALALLRLGAPGRDALLTAETGPSADARHVARLILGLSPQALAEFAA